MKRSIRKSSLHLAVAIVLLLAANIPDRAVAGHGGVSSEGTDFWFGFMPNYVHPADYLRAFICSATKSSVNVELFGGGSGVPVNTTRYELTPGSARTITLPVALCETRVNEIEGYWAIHISASNPISCYGYSEVSGSSEGFLALPTPALGNKYWIASYPDADPYSPEVGLVGEFLIVAPFDNTQVTIISSVETRLNSMEDSITHFPGEGWTVTLNRGQTYLVQSLGRHFGDITGSYLTSTQPISVLSGHERSCIPISPSTSAGEFLMEMMLPVNLWGTECFEVPTKSRSKAGDFLYVFSGADGNAIQVVGTKTQLALDAGENAERDVILLPESYKSSKGLPVLAMQYTYSQGFNGDSAKVYPIMITMTPREQFQNRIVFRTAKNPRGNGDFASVCTFIGDASNLMSITVNGQSLSALGAEPVKVYPGTSNPVIGTTRIQLIPGEKAFVAASSQTKFAAYVYGFNEFNGYGWPAGMGLNLPSADTLPPQELSRKDTCGDFDVRVGEIRPNSKISVQDSRLSFIRLIIDSLDTRWNKPTTNYSFRLDSNFRAGDTIASYRLSVINRLQPAYAAVLVVDRSGNDTVFEYSYGAPSVRINPGTALRFDSVTLDSQSCKTITLTNTQATRTLHLANLLLTSHATSGVFGMIPTKIDTLLKPGDSLQLQICFTPSDTGVSNTSFDTLFAPITGCESYPYLLSGTGVKHITKGVAQTLAQTPRLVLFAGEPNPFTNDTRIRYEISQPSAKISLVIYDALGREVAQLVDAKQTRGSYSVTFDGSHLPNGTYFCRITDGVTTLSSELVLRK
jgi:hypothetical protein